MDGSNTAVANSCKKNHKIVSSWPPLPPTRSYKVKLLDFNVVHFL